MALATPAGAQSFAWWKDDQFKKDVGLTADQCSRIDAVFQSTISKLRQGKEELDRQEAELSRLIAANADEAQVIRQVDRVETVRAGLNKMRTLMVLRMRQVVTPEQRVKFNAAYEQWREQHRRPGPGGRGDNRKP